MKFDARTIFTVILLTGFIFCASTNAEAQNDLDDFQEHYKNDYFSVGALLQTIGDYQYNRLAGTGNNGYSIGNARLQIFGEVNQSFGYQLQANFIKNPAVLDANMYYHLMPQMTVKAGLFKSPFSGEFLRSAAALDFVNRSTVVNQLAPNRQIGVQLGGDLSEGKLRYRAGVFNGNGFDINRNNDGYFLYAARMETHISTDEEAENKIIFALNSSYEQKDQEADSGNLRSTFEGEQVLFGSDIRLTHNNLMLSSEFIYSWLESEFGILSNPFGYHATAGYFVMPQTQLLVRWDSFENDNIRSVSESETVMAGFNYHPSSFSKVQLNYIFPTSRDIEFSQILLNLQISL